MSLYKKAKNGKKGKVWWMNFWWDGKHVQESTRCTNKRDAEAIERARRTQLAKGEVGIEERELDPEPEPMMTFSEAVTKFLAWHQSTSRASTHKRYLTSSVALKAYFGSTPLDQIKNKDVEEFKAHRKGQLSSRLRRNETARRKLRPASVNRELALLKHLFNHYDELIPKNPVRKVKMLDEENVQDRVLTREEEKLYLMASSQPLRDIATLMLQTGMRPEEVCRIRRENVHLDQDYLFNPHGKTPAAKRRIPLNRTAKEVLARRLQQDGDYLFKGRIEGRSIVKVNAAHTAAVDRSGVRHFTLYALRHTYATRAAMAGVDAITLAALLGHSKITLVMRYVHPSEQNKMAAMQRIEAAS